MLPLANVGLLGLVCSNLLDTDTYKLSHPEMYPEAEEFVAYFTFRGPLDDEDQRIVFYGMRHLFETLISVPLTMEMIEQADYYLAKHSAGGKPFNWPRDLFIKAIQENNGWLPLKIRALREGETVYPQIPCFIVSAKRPYERLVTWFETAMMRIWNPSTTATKSAHVYAQLLEEFEESVDKEEFWRILYSLHDFGSRGVSSRESGMWAGAGHLVVFDGTDNINAAIQCTAWNDGQHVGQSVIASEHSVMTSWEDEDAALAKLIEITPSGAILSCVADSYDYDYFIWEVVPRHVEAIKAKGIYFVLRPDSGDPVKCVVDGLRALEKAFGVRHNSKGYKVILGAGIIQGDGINLKSRREIAKAVLAAGYSVQCVVYGMGGGLLQQQNRDTMKCANKLCEVTHLDGSVTDVAKIPKTDPTKGSLPGNMKVHLLGGVPTVFPYVHGWEDKLNETDLLEVIWDRGPVNYQWETFAQVRARHRRTWDARPKKAQVLSDAMRVKLRKFVASRRKEDTNPGPSPEAPWTLPNGAQISGWHEEGPGQYRIEIREGGGIYSQVSSPSLREST